VDKEIFTTDLD